MAPAVGWAQRHAAETFGIDPLTQPVEYLGKVFDIVNQTGWLNDASAFVTLKFTAQTFSLDAQVIRILQGLLPERALGPATAALDALEKNADDNGAPWEVFNRKSRNSQAGTFSLGSASETAGQVATTLAAYSLTGSVSNTRFLWAKYSRTEINLQYARATLSRNNDLWADAQIGGRIQRDMFVGSKNYIAQLPVLK